MQGDRTATEVLELQGEKAAILGTLVNRTYNELITPMVARVFRSETKKGRMPEVPRALLESGVELRLSFQGPLAQIQKRFHAHQGVSQTLASIYPLIELSQGEILDEINLGVLARYLLNEGTFPQDAIRDPRQVAQIKKQKAQQAQQVQQMQQLEAMGKAGPGLAALQQASPGTQGGVSPALGE